MVGKRSPLIHRNRSSQPLAGPEFHLTTYRAGLAPAGLAIRTIDSVRGDLLRRSNNPPHRERVENAMAADSGAWLQSSPFGTSAFFEKLSSVQPGRPKVVATSANAKFFADLRSRIQKGSVSPRGPSRSVSRAVPVLLLGTAS